MNQVFSEPQNWGLGHTKGTLLWARLPFKNGPVDIWLPESLSADALIDLVLPHVKKQLGLCVEWNESVKSFFATRDGYIDGDGI